MYSKSNKGKFLRQLRDYCVLTLAMILGAVGVELFLLPNEITTGGIIGVASIVYWGTGIPAQETFFVLNALLWWEPYSLAHVWDWDFLPEVLLEDRM